MSAVVHRGLPLAVAWIVAGALYGVAQFLHPGMGWFDSIPDWLPPAYLAVGALLFVTGWAAALAVRPQRRRSAYFSAFVLFALFQAVVVFAYFFDAAGFLGVVLAPGFSFGFAGTLFYVFVVLQQSDAAAAARGVPPLRRRTAYGATFVVFGSLETVLLLSRFAASNELGFLDGFVLARMVFIGFGLAGVMFYVLSRLLAPATP